MGRKVYRLCLLTVVLIAIAGGIFYYLNYVQDESEVTEGTLVQQEEAWMNDKWANMGWIEEGADETI